MSARRTASSGKKKIDLNKKIPVNPRYAHVKHTVDTGASVSRYLEHIEEIRRNYRYRKDEIFKRLKVTTFAQLVLQVAEIDEQELIADTPQLPMEGLDTPYVYDDDDDVLATPTPHHPPYSPTTPPDTARSTLSSVIAGMGELDVSRECSFAPVSPPPQDPTPCPYLLLDVRQSDEYELCHITTAKSYPAAMLSRSCNYFTKEILEYKNKPGRIIILYDEDERIASQAATTFVQREVDNVFMLSGGLKVLHQKFPEGLLTGAIPRSCVQSPPGSARSMKPSSSASHRAAASRRPPPHVQEAIPVVGSVVHKTRFSLEDLQKIQDNLDDALLTGGSSSRASSRVSTSASQRTSTAASRTDSRAVSANPWK